MSQNRTDITYENHNSSYIILTVILVILSLVGIFLFFQIRSKPANMALTPSPTPVFEEENTPTPRLIETDEPTAVPSIIVTLAPTNSKPTALPTPTPEYQKFSSSTDKFSLTYHSSRTLYQDKEYSGNRYTFYSGQGNIAVHVGSQWSWIYPNREFTADLQVAGKNTFVYKIDSQTIVDLENGSQKITIQCVHNGSADIISECDKLISSFELL